MVKCVVSGCPNRQGGGPRGGGSGPRRSGSGPRSLLNRPPKRFFPFPKDPARVKVWLAALRETDKQDSLDIHMICEDHFLPEDVSNAGVNSDAIPIMPQYLDGPLGLSGTWGAESSEEEEQWAPSGCDEDDGGQADAKPLSATPRAEVRLQDPVRASGNPVDTKKSSETQQNAWTQPKVLNRHDVSLALLTRRFLELLLAAPDRSLDLRQAVTSLKTRKQRLYDITNILDGINFIHKQSTNRVEWIAKCPISSLLWKNQQKFQMELDNLKLVEDTLDGLIKSCAQQLFDMTDNVDNAALAYVTHDDVCRLRTFQEQTVIAVKAPEETKLEVPAPTEDRIQIHLKAGKGPIMILTCEVGSGHAPVTSDPVEKSSLFVTLPESRIKTSTASADPLRGVSS